MKKEEIKCKNLFFDLRTLNSYLLDGSSLKKEQVIGALEFLKGLENSSLISLFLISGHFGNKGKEEIDNSGFEGFFKKENIFVPSKKYLDSKEQVDKERHLANLNKDEYFVDEFFKQQLILNFIGDGKVSEEDSIIIGNDIWFDAFYTTRFSKIDFVLCEESLAERNTVMPEKIKGLNYFSFTKDDFEKIVSGNKKQDLRFLETYIFNKLKLELFEGTAIGPMVKKSVHSINKEPNENE